MSKVEDFVFDRHHTLRISEARSSLLGHLITKCRSFCSISTALDAGTGAGYFAGYMSRQHNLQVVAFDVRPSNIEVAKQRYPEVTFVIGNVENKDIVTLGKFDMVTSFGLIYHLENPSLALQNLAEMTRHVLIIESMIAPGHLPQALILDESVGDDQAVRYYAFHLTESGLIKLLYLVGMPYVYVPRSKVCHEDFGGTIFRRKVRTVLVASRIELRDNAFIPVSEPHYPLDRLYYYRGFSRRALRFALTLLRMIRRKNGSDSSN